MTLVELPEWGRLTLPGVWLRDDEARQQAARLTEEGRLEVRELRTGTELAARAYVGEVRLGDLTVKIVPKLSPDALRRLLAFSHGSSGLSGGSGHAGALELLAARLLTEAERLRRQGLDARYHERRGVLGSPRGRLDTAALARGGGLLTGACLPCRWSERGLDTPLNQALLASVRLAAQLAPGLRPSATAVLEALEGAVTARPLDEALLAAARRAMGPEARAYEAVLELATALARGQVPAGPGGGLPGGFLFDLSRFFQAVVGRLLRGHLRGIEVHEEWPLHDLLRYAPDANPHQRRPPTPRPDFALFERGQLTALLDAKYRDLWAESLPRDMLYQLTLYALGHGREAIIVYPSDDPYAREARVELRAPGVDNGPRHITLRPLPLTRLAHLLETPSITARHELDALATGLVRGAR